MFFKTSYRPIDADERIKKMGAARCRWCGALHELFRHRKGFGYRCGAVVYSVVELREGFVKVESDAIDPPPVEDALF